MRFHPLTPDVQLARRLGVSVAWIRSEADAGNLPHIRAGDRYLFDHEAVERLLLERARRVPASGSGGAA